MKKWYWLVLIILTYLVFLVLYTPASFVTSYLQKNSNNQVLFSGVSGTLFDANADYVLIKGTQIRNVKWQLSPLSLLLLKANLDFNGGNIRNAEQVYVKGQLEASLLNTQRFSLNNAQVFVPTKTVLSQLKLPVTVSASGRFRVDIEQFIFNQGCEQLKGNGNWLNAAVNVNQKRVDFGTFDAVLSCETPNFVMQIAPTNELSLNANINVDMTGKYNVQGQFSMPNTMPNEIKQAAPFFGRETSPGVYEISF